MCCYMASLSLFRLSFGPWSLDSWLFHISTGITGVNQAVSSKAGSIGWWCGASVRDGLHDASNAQHFQFLSGVLHRGFGSEDVQSAWQPGRARAAGPHFGVAFVTCVVWVPTDGAVREELANRAERFLSLQVSDSHTETGICALVSVLARLWMESF